MFVQKQKVAALIEALGGIGIELPADFGFQDPDAAVDVLVAAILNARDPADRRASRGEIREEDPILMSNVSPSLRAIGRRIRAVEARAGRLAGEDPEASAREMRRLARERASLVSKR